RMACWRVGIRTYSQGVPPALPPRDRAPRLRPLAGIAGPLAVCGVVAAVLVGRETGWAGFGVGFVLALLPLPLLVFTFRWIDAVLPKPPRTLAFAFGWGACVATLVALFANGLLVRVLTGSSATLAPSHADTLEMTVIAPVVEETVKAIAVLLVFLHRPEAFNGVLAGLVTAGMSAAGFAFTENILYLGSAFDQDLEWGPETALDSATVVTFVVRIVLAPFAHPVFTALTGIGFGLAAMLGPERRGPRFGLPLLGLAAAMLLHSVWNASTGLPFLGFAAVYALVMVPVFAALCWLASSARDRQLRLVRRTLPVYASAGWLSPEEPAALGSLGSRAASRRLARHRHGPAGVRAVAEYQAAATTLALLRERADRGAAGPDFHTRERALLGRLWRQRVVAGPLTVASARTGPAAKAAADPAAAGRAG
ncbi:PrsW family intramembrane metalloprotease, partial [Streptomyces sp. 8K308]